MRSIRPKHLFYGSTTLLVVAYFLLALTRAGDSPYPLPAPVSPAEAAKQAVLNMYEAINSGREDKYLDLVLEKKHTEIQPMGVLGAVASSLSISILSLSIDWDKLQERAYYRLAATPVSTSTPISTYVLIEARGRERHKTVDRDVDFCQLWDVRLVDGRWLVDIDSDERRARVAALMQKQRAKYPALDWVNQKLNMAIDLDSLLMQYGFGEEEIYNTCE